MWLWLINVWYMFGFVVYIATQTDNKKKLKIYIFNGT